MYCDTCLVNLCKACVGEHFSVDLSKSHKIVDFKDRNSTLLCPKCTSHDKETGEMYCCECDVPVCSGCISTDHLGHNLMKIMQTHDEKRDNLIKEQVELNNKIFPTYQDIASDVQNRMSQLEKEYGELSTTITKHGEDWHGEIDKLVMELRVEVDEMKKSQLQTLQKHLDEINKNIHDIKDEITLIGTVLNSTDNANTLSMPSKADVYKALPSKVIVSLPEFNPKELLADHLFSLTPIPKKSDDHGYQMKTTEKTPEARFSSAIKKMFTEPHTVTTIDTGYEKLYNVASLRKKEIWTNGIDNKMKLFNVIQKSLLKSIRTKSGNTPEDIAVTKSGDLVYTDYSARTVNLVKNEKTEEVIRLKNWIPHGVSSTSSGDLLVIMGSDDKKQSKVVRYSGSTEKQTIQFDDKGKPLYSSGRYNRFIAENRNLDICVSDCAANAVVVVNQAGKLNFRYAGHTPAPKKHKPFSPRGITTDSQSHILTADHNNHCVHIIDQDGQFIRYIDCGLSKPWGLCTDTSDNLFVAQWKNGQVKKIKYYQ
ncbi:E3 ubiquitin-protein ligase TRIM71-like [Saccostrea echinata]|uniref:E3 ubiquitin-protein ligase TRIM71-like n=1 Tax=Saccostrea echinata TaxID=191078 RepID=UPI002A7F2D30|nr:E3 ubiquitin-protein ligase TRIM71-like [Saccostrea echinata]